MVAAPSAPKSGYSSADHDPRVANHQFGMADLPAGLDQPIELAGAERAGVEGDRAGGILHDQVGRDGLRGGRERPGAHVRTSFDVSELLRYDT